MDTNVLEKILAFFNSIGLNYQITELSDKTFLPGVSIDGETLLIDIDKLTYPGDLLHDAGHIAVTPEERRKLLRADVDDIPAEEMAAIAWSWAAVHHIGLSPEVVFHQDGYRGASQNLIEAFSKNGGVGFPLLYSWFMCEMPEHPQGFPKMKRWFRSDAYQKEQLAKMGLSLAE